MSDIKNVFSKNWDYEVYLIGDKTIITIMFFGLIDYQRSFYLYDYEILEGYEKLNSLAEIIRNNYEEYQNREIIPAIWK